MVRFLLTHRLYFALVGAGFLLCAAQVAMASPYKSINMDAQTSVAPLSQPALPPEQQRTAAPAPEKTAAIDPAQMPALPPATAQVLDYRLGMGDKVHVTVFNEDDLSGDFTVDSSGTLRLPLVGQISASGMTAGALEKNISFALANGFLIDPKVSVEVVSYRPFYILGEVNRPGEYPYANGMTALQAISVAGGFTQKASDTYIYVRREGALKEERLRVDQSTQIHPGDTVRVSESGIWTLLSIAQPVSSVLLPLRY